MVTELKVEVKYKLIDKEGYCNGCDITNSLFDYHFEDDIVILDHIDRDGDGIKDGYVIIDMSLNEGRFFEEVFEEQESPVIGNWDGNSPIEMGHRLLYNGNLRQVVYKDPDNVVCLADMDGKYTTCTSETCSKFSPIDGTVRDKKDIILEKFEDYLSTQDIPEYQSLMESLALVLHEVLIDDI